MIDAGTVRSIALASARQQGCVCDVEITVDELEPGIFYTAARHDDRCPLLMAQARRIN